MSALVRVSPACATESVVLKMVWNSLANTSLPLPRRGSLLVSSVSAANADVMPLPIAATQSKARTEPRAAPNMKVSREGPDPTKKPQPASV